MSGAHNEKDPVRVEAFGKRIRALRLEQGLTQEQLAEEAGLHRAVVGFVERGERELGITNAWRLADGLDMTLSELLEGVDRKRATRRRNRRE